ncbi:hypothetical protein C813_05340 [Kosakonia sacchari SP1]|nr:hypothetical protein C813_05340 [Kosakonia sacchari SP1]
MISAPGSRHSIYGYALFSRREIIALRDGGRSLVAGKLLPGRIKKYINSKFTVMTPKVAYQDQWVWIRGIHIHANSISTWFGYFLVSVMGTFGRLGRI